MRLLADGETSDRQRKLLLESATCSQTNSVREVFLNLLAGNVSIDDEFKRSLLKHKAVIRRIADRTTARPAATRLLVRIRRTIPQVLKRILIVRRRKEEKRGPRPSERRTQHHRRQRLLPRQRSPRRLLEEDREDGDCTTLSTTSSDYSSSSSCEIGEEVGQEEETEKTTT